MDEDPVLGFPGLFDQFAFSLRHFFASLRDFLPFLFTILLGDPIKLATSGMLILALLVLIFLILYTRKMLVGWFKARFFDSDRGSVSSGQILQYEPYQV